MLRDRSSKSNTSVTSLSFSYLAAAATGSVRNSARALRTCGCCNAAANQRSLQADGKTRSNKLCSGKYTTDRFFNLYSGDGTCSHDNIDG